jgi:hypothetical protein
LRFLALALTLTVVLFVIAFASADSLVFGFGPADRDYVEGFRVGWARGTTARWSRERATVELPVRIRGDADLVLVGGRPERAPLEITFRQDGAELDTATVGERSAPYAFSLAPGRAAFDWESASSDEGHGLRVESLTLRSRAFAALLPDPASIARATASALLFFLALAPPSQSPPSRHRSPSSLTPIRSLRSTGSRKAPSSPPPPPVSPRSRSARGKRSCSRSPSSRALSLSSIPRTTSRTWTFTGT